jgi:hypothetical protein
LNERISRNNHPIGKLPNTITSHDSSQSPILGRAWAFANTSRMDMCLVGLGNSLDVSITFPSIMFPLRFRYASITFPKRFQQRFLQLSVNVSVTLPLRMCVLDGNSLETPPTFPRPTKVISYVIACRVHYLCRRVASGATHVHIRVYDCDCCRQRVAL